MDLTQAFAPAKFTVPLLRDGVSVVPVAERITKALSGVELVTAVAPGGSGKTTALAAWSQQCEPWRPAWVRVDPADNDPHTLAAAIAEAVAQANGRPARRVQGLMSAAVVAGVDQLVAALANDLAEADGTVVVLDDTHHLVAADVWELLGGVIDNITAGNRLVVGSRVEPRIDMDRRRVRRQVLEVGAEDLRLDRCQIEGVLRHSGIEDPELAARIEGRSGGWAAACVLLSAGAARTRCGAEGADPLASGEFDIDRYVREEILDQLPSDLRRFVIETSLLDDLDVSRCETLTGRPGVVESLSQARAVGLVERNGASWRYHERIREVLRVVLVEEVGLSERVALAHRGASVSHTGRAIELLVEVGELAAAAEVVVDAALAMSREPGGHVPREWLAPFAGDQAGAMLGATCAPGTHGWIDLLIGASALDDGDVAEALPHLDHAVAEMRSSADQRGYLRAAYSRAEAHLVWGEVAEAAELIEELALLPAGADDRVRILTGRLWLAFFAADWSGIGRDLDEAFHLGLSQCSEAGRATVALAMGTEFLFCDRGPTWLAECCAELARRIDRDLMAHTSLELMAAAAHLMAGRVDAAASLVDEVDERALEVGGLSWLSLMADRVALAIALCVGDHATVATRVDAGRSQLDRSDRHRQERAMYAYALACSGYSLGRADQVRAAQVYLGPVDDNDRPDTAITASVIAAMVDRDQGDLEAAASRLCTVRELQHMLRFALLTGVVDMELAAVRLSQGRRSEAIEAARPTLLRLHETTAWGVLAVDGATRHRDVLEACADVADLCEAVVAAQGALASMVPDGLTSVGPFGERITKRELDVLALVVAGRSNREIGAELYISERTVKSHMTSLMRKLDVSSRTAAIARSRELGIA